MKNFHVPLSDQAYLELRDESARSKRPATTLAREAIVLWLRARKKLARHKAIAAYAANVAGTDFDLDSSLEAVAVENLLATEE